MRFKYKIKYALTFFLFGMTIVMHDIIIMTYLLCIFTDLNFDCTHKEVANINREI